MTAAEGNGSSDAASRPAISVVIVNYNTRDLLEACLGTVFREAKEVPLEVLVIDNGSTDGSVEMVRTRFPAVCLTVNEVNRGFAAPNNDGIRASRGEYVLLLNSDTEVRPGAFRVLKRFLDTHPEAGACGPLLLNTDGSVQHSVKGFPTLWTHACDMFFLDRMFPRSHFFGGGEMAYFGYDRTEPVDHVMAAAFLVRQPVLASVGLLDERFVLYHNDMDWCYRMVRGGWKVYFVREAEVVHHGGKTMDIVNRDLSRLPEQWNNVMLFFQKHYGRLSVAAFRIILAAGFLPRALGWQVARALRPAPRSLHMAAFSMRTLLIGLAFWRPLPYT
ncbi:MAG TPA: glycosyltransferase family 2 protein [Bacteroidota bacterium]|nr:glycosyltransferase family 2 protein [Bacteroidota bacterium]